jgi:amino acid permease
MSDIFSKIAEVSWIPEFFRTSIGHKIAVSLYWLVVFLPLSICKEVNSLRYVSFAGILATLYLVAIIVVTEGETGTQTVAAQTPLFAFNTPMLAALPVFIFSYCCQVNAFEIYTELKPRTVTRLSRSVIIAMLVCTLIYASAGVAGALNFGTAVHGNILKNYSIKSSVSILLTYVGVAINLASSYPLCIYPTRDAIVQMLGYPSAYATPTHKRILLCVVLATLSLIAGLFAPGIQLLFGLLGGICGSSVGFIFPSLFAIRSGLFSRDRAGWLQWICIWLLLAFGVGSCIFGTAISILQTVQTAGDS